MSLHFIVCLIFRFIFLKKIFSSGRKTVYLFIDYNLWHTKKPMDEIQRVIDPILEQITAAKLQNSHPLQPLHLHVIE